MNDETTERVLSILKKELEKQNNSIEFESLQEILRLETDAQFADDRQKENAKIREIAEHEVNLRLG